MCRVLVSAYTVLVCLIGQALSQQTLCDTKLLYGGQCVNLNATCPNKSSVFARFSNYLGCGGRVDQMCCANDPGPIKNPGGIIVNPTRTCGLGSLNPVSRILNGDITGPCDWPFIVSIRSKTSTSTELTLFDTSHACSGTLIDEQWVLTSATCIINAADTAALAPERILVIGGEYNVTGIDLDPVTRTQQEQVIRVSRVFMHPDYKFKSQEEVFPYSDLQAVNSHAVALIRLAEPINGRCSGIACLPLAEEAANDCSSYEECVIAGWGFITEAFDGGVKDELHMGQVRLFSRVACDFLTARMGLNSSRPLGSTCQTPRDRNTDSCLGDEGGAVLCSNGFNWVVQAILPFNMCTNDRYNFYVTDAKPYLKWIQETMADNS